MKKRLLIYGLVAGVLALSFLTLPAAEVTADTVQLKNDNGEAGGYTEGIRIDWVFGSVLQAADTQYPLRVLSVDFTLYRFQNAAESAQIRAVVFSVGADGKPDTLIARSETRTVTTFYPNWVSIPLTDTQIYLTGSAPFLVGVEYVTGASGANPSVLLDSSENIPAGRNFYSQTGGRSWSEHYEWWVDPEGIGYNMVRATVETNLTPEPTWTSTFTLTPTPGPSPTPVPGQVGTGTMAGYGKQHVLARTNDGKVHLIYTEQDPPRRQLYHIRSEDNGESWQPSPPLLAATSELMSAVLAPGLSDTLHLVYGPWDGQEAYYKRYNGASWSSATQIGDWVFSRNIAVDSQGHLHVVWSNRDTWYTRFDGTNWTPPKQIASGAWAPAIAVGPANTLHVAYNDNNFCCDSDWVEVHYIFSTDGGDTWSAPENISQDSVWTGCGALAVAPDGTVHLTYIALSPVVEGGLYYRQKRNGAWSAPEIISSGNAGVQTGSVGSESAAMATDSTGNLFVVFRCLNAEQRWDICLRIRDWQSWLPVMNLTNNIGTSSREPSVVYGTIPANRGLDIAWGTAGNIVYRYVSREEMGIRPTPTPTSTPTPTPGAYYARVVAGDGEPVEGARVYHNGVLVTDSGGRPVRTANGGVLDFSSLQPGDTLAALALKEQISSFRGAHAGDPDPRYPGQWAYRVYLSSITIDDQGAATLYRVPAPSAGEHRLVIKKTNPLVLFNIVASVEWDATISYTDHLSRAFKLASDYLYDVTDGQMALGHVAVYDSATHWTDADFQFSTRNMVIPHANPGGISSEDTSKIIRVGRYWNGFSGNQGDWDQPSGFRTLIHEFGHYALSLYDEYFRITYDEENKPSFDDSVDCTGSEIRDPDTPYTTTASIMDYQYNASELWAAGLNARWDQACQNTYQWQVYGESDWQTVPRMYADTSLPGRWEFITPTLRGGIVAGPESISLNLPIIKVYNEAAPPSKTLTVYSPTGDRYWGALVTLYTTRQDQVIPIDQGHTDQEGIITILGALSGDTVRVASFDGGLTGIVQIGEADEYSLILEPPGQGEILAQTPGLRPYINMVPGSDGKTLNMYVRGVERGRSLQATVIQPGGEFSETAALAYSDTSGAYEGAVVFEDAVLGNGAVWVREVDPQAEPLNISSPYVLLRASDQTANDLFSGDGNLHLHIPEGSLLATEVYLVIMPTIAPPIPDDLNLMGRAYSIRFSGAMTQLSKPGMVRIHFPPEIRESAALDTLRLYFWNPWNSEWESISGTLSRRDTSISQAIRYPGIYAVMGSVDSTPCYDLNGNGQVGVEDLQAVVGHWRQRADDPGWSPRFDLDEDGLISVRDILLVSAQLGRVCL